MESIAAKSIYDTNFPSIFPFRLFAGIALCYFPHYLQGNYVTQLGMALQPSAPVKYMQISISADASTWGYCQRKIGNDLYFIEK